MDRTIDLYRGYGLIFGAMLLALGAACLRIRYFARENAREDREARAAADQSR